MADHREVEILALERARQPLRPFDILDFGIDADFGELGCDDLAALPGIGRGRQGQRHIERHRHARFRQQRLGFFDVERKRSREIDIAGVDGHIMAANRRAKTIHGPVDDRFAVQRVGNGAAHADIVEWLALVVDGQNGLALGAANRHGKTRIGLELGHALEGAKARKGVDVASQQRCHLRGRIVDDAECRLGDGDFCRLAIAVPFGQRHGRAFGPAFQPVGPGAYRFCGIAGRGFGIDDDGIGKGELEQEIGVRLFQRDGDGGWIGCLDFDKGCKKRLVLVGAVGRSGALEGEFDICGCEGFAVLEPDTIAQRKGVGRQIGGDAPAFGEQWVDFAAAIGFYQAFIDVVMRDFANRRRSRRRRVEARRFQHHADGDAVLSGLCMDGHRKSGRGKSRHERQRHGQKSFHRQTSIMAPD